MQANILSSISHTSWAVNANQIIYIFVTLTSIVWNLRLPCWSKQRNGGALQTFVFFLITPTPVIQKLTCFWVFDYDFDAKVLLLNTCLLARTTRQTSWPYSFFVFFTWWILVSYRRACVYRLPKPKLARSFFYYDFCV